MIRPGKNTPAIYGNNATALRFHWHKTSPRVIKCVFSRKINMVVCLCYVLNRNKMEIKNIGEILVEKTVEA